MRPDKGPVVPLILNSLIFILICINIQWILPTYTKIHRSILCSPVNTHHMTGCVLVGLIINAPVIIIIITYLLI